MQRRSGKLLRVLAVATAAALLISALPASVATAAKVEVACKVHNIGKGINRDSLQRAVWAADPGDALLVQGTCTGTTLIGKDLDISYMGWSGAPMPLGQQYRTSPRGKIRSADRRPALVIDPRVDDFRINPGLRVIGGIVIGDIAAWRGSSRPVPTAWRASWATPSAPSWAARLRSCYVANDDTTAQFRRSQAAARAASPGDHLSLRGACGGETAIGKDLHVSGWRIAISSRPLGGGTASRDDSGPPTLTRVAVDDGVDSLVLKRVRVTNGFSIGDLDG